MKVGSSRSVGGSGRIGSVGATRGPATSSPVTATGAVRDTTSVLGIPEAEFTPKVRQAIMTLLKEVDTLRHDLEQSKARIAHLEKLADEDALAPIANRRAFVRELSRMLSFAQRYDSRVSVLYFDINDMKRINDSLGHPAGDAAITHVAAILTGSVRESDVVGRLGGNEFGVILANANEDAARAKAESLARAIAETPFDWKGKQVRVEITYGAYSLKGDDDASAMLEQADKAMYARKGQRESTT